jgi:hypothetical protein
MSKRYPGGIIRKTPQTPSQTSAQGIWDMASVTQAVKENTWPIAGVPDPISKSLRFRASASAYLNRTPAVAGNKQTWTLSFWLKTSKSNFDYYIAEASTNSSTDRTPIAFNSGKLQIRHIDGSATQFTIETTQVFRDPSAWYHFVIAIDTTQATSTNRVKFYVNGSQITAFSTASYPTQNLNTDWNGANAHSIGSSTTPDSYADMYLTEFYNIDGQQLTPSSFGTTDDQTGVWEPIAYTGTYGTNGFYLPFSNTASTATLGNDFSGNSNNWTTNNISLTSGSTYDSMVDVPTQWIPYNTAGDTGALWRGNYCVMSPIDNGGNTLSNGNLTVVSPVGTAPMTKGTFGVSSGKWYWEVTPTALGSSSIGIAGATVPSSETVGTNPLSWGYLQDARKYNNTSTTSYGSSYTTNDVIGVALDMDAGTLVFYKNGTSQGTAFTGITGTVLPALSDFSADPATTWQVNFGQRPFAYAPPSGFVTLNTRNLPTPTIGATASTTANKYFDISLYTGTGSAQSITNSGGFQPDFVWGKARSTTRFNVLVDAVRGSSKDLYSNATNAENTDATVITGFNSNGFGLGTDAELNLSANTFVAWQWKANGSGSSNTAGSITSTVSANTTAGFSIVTYTGNGTSSQTCGHGLGVTPSMVIWKNRNDADAWIVYHNALTTSEYLILNTTAAKATFSGLFTGISSTVLPLNNASAAINANGFNYVAYCFAQVAGYSAFGSYTGNGSADGPFVFTGFRPRFLMMKRSSSGTANWYIFDSARSTYNAIDVGIYPNLSNAETALGAQTYDFLSNGFKLRQTNADFNESGIGYIYMAFAESPFKYALAR